MLAKLLQYLALAVISIISIVPMLGAQSANPEKITLEDLLVVEPIGVPVLSPDATYFAMVRNEQFVLMPSAMKRDGVRG